MTVTRAQLLTLTREAMDAESGDRWSPTFLLAVLDGVFSDEWSNILNAAPRYRFATRNVTLDANAQVPLTSLDSGTGDSAQAFYRVQSVYDAIGMYAQADYRNVAGNALAPQTWLYDRCFYLAGTAFQFLPRNGNVPVSIDVSWKPPVPSALSADDVTVDFPEGSQMLLALEAAARALESKAGEEAAQSAALFRAAERYRADLLTDLARRTIDPRVMGYSDRRGAWGG